MSSTAGAMPSMGAPHTEYAPLPPDSPTTDVQHEDEAAGGDIGYELYSEDLSQGMKQFNVFFTTSRTNLTVHHGSRNTPAQYYLHSHLMALTGPQLLLRRGNSKTAPVVAFARAKDLWRHLVLGHGDYENTPQDSLVYEELHRDKNLLRWSDYGFSTDIGSGEGGRRAQYRWRKDTKQAKRGRTVYDCVDESDRIVARMLSGGVFNLRKGGEFEVLQSVAPALEEMLLMSALAIGVLEAFWFQTWTQGFTSDSRKNRDK